MLAWERAHRKPADWMSGVRRRDGASSIRALCGTVGTCDIDAKGDGQAHQRKAQSTDAMSQGRIDS